MIKTTHLLLLLLMAVLISCGKSEGGVDNNKPEGGETPPPTEAKVSVDLSIKTQSDVTFADCIKKLQYVVCDNAGTALPDVSNKIIREIAAPTQGKVELDGSFANGQYTLCFMGSAQSITTSNTPGKTTDIWLSADAAQRKAIEEDIFFAKTDITINGSTEVKVALSRKVGQVEVNVQNTDATITIEGIDLKIAAGGTYNAMTASGDLKLQTESPDEAGYTIVRDVLTSNRFFSFPTIGQTGVRAQLFVTYKKNNELRHATVDIPQLKIIEDRLSTINLNIQNDITTGIKFVVGWDSDIVITIDGDGIEPDPIPGAEMNLKTDLFYWRTTFSGDAQKLYDIIVETILKHNTSGPNERIMYNVPSQLKVSQEEFKRLAKIIYNDQPILFHYVAITPYSVSGNGFMLSYQVSYGVTRIKYNQQYKEVLRGASSILDDMPKGLSEYERAKYLYGEFLTKMNYGMSMANEGSIYGALGNFRAVCEGYARGYQYLLYREGIQSIIYSAKVDTNSDGIPDTNHAWCIVRIDGKYYHADPTGDDAPYGGTGFRLDYFLKSDATMSAGHEILPSGFPVCDADYIP